MRRVATVLAAASLLALAGCDGAVGAEMTFDDVEQSKITEIVLTGGNADVSITTGTGTETRITRVVRGGTSAGKAHQLSGSVLTLPTDCGRDCRTRFQIQAPAGVAVRGELHSGDALLERVGAVDLKLTSGDVGVRDATGTVAIRATSGDLLVDGAPQVNLECTSGELTALNVAGPITTRTSSGDTRLSLAEPASVTASVTSGNLELMVPEGGYRIRTDVGSGDETVHGVTFDSKAKHTLDLRTRSGDLTVMPR